VGKLSIINKTIIIANIINKTIIIANIINKTIIITNNTVINNIIRLL